MRTLNKSGRFMKMNHSNLKAGEINLNPAELLKVINGDQTEEKEDPEFFPNFNKSKNQHTARKKREHERVEQNLERWLVSYADFITLLFAFFVTMYSISRVDNQKLVVAAHSLQGALGGLSSGWVTAVPADQGSSPISSASPQKGAWENPEGVFLEKLAGEIQKEIKKVSASGDQIQYLINDNELVIRVPDCLFFDSGQASIRPEVVPILEVLGRSLAKIPNSISVEGHSDNVPINTPRFGSNWELSSSRATEIIRYFLTHFRFDPDRLSAAGYAEFRPIAPNTTAEERRKNRRVDLVILGGK